MEKGIITHCGKNQFMFAAIQNISHKSVAELYRNLVLEGLRHIDFYMTMPKITRLENMMVKLPNTVKNLFSA